MKTGIVKTTLAGLVACTGLFSLSAEAQTQAEYDYLSIHQYPMPTGAKRQGEMMCGRYTNVDSPTYYTAWLERNKTKQSEAQTLEWFSVKPARTEVERAYNVLLASHIKALWQGRYTNLKQSTDGFYAMCMDSAFRKLQDK